MQVPRVSIPGSRLVVFAALAVSVVDAGAAPPAPAAAGLDAAVHASWTRLPLRDWAARVSGIAGEPVILDRRLDPTRTVTLDCRGESLRDVIATVAAQADARIDELRSSVRLVPRDRQGRAAAADEALARTIAGFPTPIRRALAARAAWTWPDGARPGELVAAAAKEGGIAIEGIDSIPHDHFPAASLPPLTLAERLDLVLAHFDLRVEWESDRAAGRIVPIAQGLEPRTTGTRKPGADRNVRPRKTVRLKDAYSLRVEAPLDQTLAAIAARLGLRLDLDTASLQARGIAAEEIVRAEVKEVSRDELLRTILEPLALDWRIEEDTLRVFAPQR